MGGCRALLRRIRAGARGGQSVPRRGPGVCGDGHWDIQLPSEQQIGVADGQLQGHAPPSGEGDARREDGRGGRVDPRPRRHCVCGGGGSHSRGHSSPPLLRQHAGGQRVPHGRVRAPKAQGDDHARRPARNSEPLLLRDPGSRGERHWGRHLHW